MWVWVIRNYENLWGDNDRGKDWDPSDWGGDWSGWEASTQERQEGTFGPDENTWKAKEPVCDSSD